MPGTARAETKVEPVRKMLKFERDLAKQIQELLEQYRETQTGTAAVAGQHPQGGRGRPGNWPTSRRSFPVKHHPGKPVFTLPALKGSWAACAEGLEHPHTKDIRPITFDHAVAKGRDDVVLVHLNHRLVQMSLRLLAGRGLVRQGPQAAAPDHGPGRARPRPRRPLRWSPTPGWW